MWLIPRYTLSPSSAILGRHSALATQQTRFPRFQQRNFLNSVLGSALGETRLRSLTHTKTIPYSSTSIFKAVSDVSGYPTFLPFTISSRVIEKDEQGYPTRASLRVGYDKFGLEEDWNSVVKCDPTTGTIEAKSSKSESQGLFEVLQTKWHINADENRAGQTTVKLDLDVKFRNPLYDQLFAQVEGQVASTMIAAFEKRVRELEAQKRRP